MNAKRQKPFVFVLMPFSANFDDIYKLGIKSACEDIGAIAERVDEQIFKETILERVYSQINKADLLVADMSGRNPNVFYEVGYAHALGKTVVLITQNVNDIPFDLKAYPHIIYNQSITFLKTELLARLPEFLKIAKTVTLNKAPQNKEAVEKPENQILIYNEGQKVSAGTILLYNYIADRPKLVLDIHLPAGVALREVKQKFGIITSKSIYRLADWSDLEQKITLPDCRILHLTDRMKLKLMPGDWFKYNFMFYPDKVNCTEKFAIRLFSEGGPVDMPFKVHILGSKKHDSTYSS